MVEIMGKLGLHIAEEGKDACAILVMRQMLMRNVILL
jgi:hypothetical protein